MSSLKGAFCGFFVIRRGCILVETNRWYDVLQSIVRRRAVDFCFKNP